MLQRSPMYAYIPARDVARARQFYEGKIGLKRKLNLLTNHNFILINAGLDGHFILCIRNQGRKEKEKKEKNFMWLGKNHSLI